MSKKLLYLIGILATILLGTWLYTASCCDCNSKETSNTTLLKTNTDLIAITEIKSSKDNFNFKKSDFNAILPISDSTTNFIVKLKSELDNSPSSSFKITGFYSSEEKNNSIFQDLGIARANNVKNFLIDKGFTEEEIIVSSALKENISIKNDTVFGPIEFSKPQLNNNRESKLDWASVKEKANKNPLILYFNKNEASITLSENDRNKIAQLLSYLSNVSNSKIIITGHTDNSGLRENNAYYSIERAKFAKKHFVENGISENKIITYGKGSSNPIADNETEIGRSKNRRAEITLK